MNRLAQLPSAGVGAWPTPLHRLDRFSEAVGAEVWIKRDDLQGVALAGNKVRKFDLVVGQGLADGYDTLVTTGAVQSNSARTGAAVAAAAGMDAVLLLGGDEPDEPHGNLLLGRLVGAEVRFAGTASWDELNAGVDQIVAELAGRGRRALAAPVGCSSPLGSLGFARAFVELEAQLDQCGLRPEAVVHATTSGGTHAGLLVGRSLGATPMRIIGVDAGRLYPDVAGAHLALAHEAAALIGHQLDLSLDQVEIDLTQLGPGYGAHTPEAADAINLLARTEAVVTDPVYSGKGLAGLVRLITDGEVEGPVVFWHTGGYHALFDPTHGTRQAQHRPTT